MTDLTPAREAFLRAALELHSSDYSVAAHEIDALSDNTLGDLLAMEMVDLAGDLRRLASLRADVEREDVASRVVRPLFEEESR